MMRSLVVEVRSDYDIAIKAKALNSKAEDSGNLYTLHYCSILRYPSISV